MTKTILLLWLFVPSASILVAQKSDIYSCGTVDSGYVSVEGEKLFHEISGKGNNMVLLHDGG
jgi:hypothetical protein